MELLISILAIYGLAFAIKETDGPWNIIGRWRNWMMKLPVVGVQFYKLLSCWYCTGCWAGLAVYLMTQESYKLGMAMCWALAGGAACLIIEGVLTRLLRE